MKTSKKDGHPSPLHGLVLFKEGHYGPFDNWFPTRWLVKINNCFFNSSEERGLKAIVTLSFTNLPLRPTTLVHRLPFPSLRKASSQESASICIPVLRLTSEGMFEMVDWPVGIEIEYLED